MKKISLITISILFFSNVYPGIFSGYEKKSPEENVQDLAIEQINNPNDPYINYNLGVALYQTQKYDAAKSNFERAVLHTKSDNLKERSCFNLGNACYKNALSLLPVNWEDEKTKIDQERLGKAVEEAKAAIKNYENILELNKKNTRVKPNLKKAKELLEKLQKKQQQQQQQQNQDQKDKNGENKDQQQQQGQKNQQSKDQSKQEQQQQQGQQKDQNKSQDSSDQSQQRREQNTENQQGQPEQKQDLQHDQKPSDQEKQQQDQDKLKEQQQQKQDMTQQMQQMQAQQGQQVAGQKEHEKESAEQKAMRMTLENLQNDEENLQKAIIQRQTKDQKPLESGQKPW